ncbi:MAG: beta-galactosidase [Acidobacteria bacterium]|nr:MAG: beta-galactosidase [Acidobacteriota bacterium]
MGALAPVVISVTRKRICSRTAQHCTEEPVIPLLRFCFIIVLLFSRLGFAQTTPNTPAIPTQIPGHDAILVGTDWYPEQWPESRWEEDLRLMETANLKAVRIAEFAWSRMEPSEGHYDFDWLERAISLAAKHHIVSVVGTPTGGPPAWLTQEHPETLRIDEAGHRAVHGNRAHGSVNSPVYRNYCRKIAEAMAVRFGHNPDVVGWQIDNEYGYAWMSFDDFTRKQFQGWLQSKYKTLDNLNRQWTTTYWSQTYNRWDQIPIPVGDSNNPGLVLEWRRLVTDIWNDYQKNQINVIRAHADTRQFITGNFMGFFDGFDHYKMSEPLTFAAWDDYVGSGHLDPTSNGLTHDLTRGFKRSNFWVIETQPGAVNWAGVNNFLNKGEVRAMAWQAIAHGADDVSYWQWRSALNGQEEYHGTLIGADGTPAPLYSEVAQIGREFSSVQDAFRGTTVVSDVALLNSYDSRWAIDFQKHTGKYDQVELLKSYYAALRKLTDSVDVISPYAPLDRYKLVVAPDLNVLPKDLADHLLEYAHNGGCLVLGPRSGMKDDANGLLPQRQPGYLVDALGGRVEQYYALEKDFPVSGTWGSGEVKIWAEQMKAGAPNTEVLMKYGPSNGWLDDQPAAITSPYGKGRITYIGAVLDDKLMAAAGEWMVKNSNVTRTSITVPDGVEVSRRTGGGKQVFLLINFTREDRSVSLPHSMKLLLAQKEGSKVTLPPYGVEVLTEGR